MYIYKYTIVKGRVYKKRCWSMVFCHMEGGGVKNCLKMLKNDQKLCGSFVRGGYGKRPYFFRVFAHFLKGEQKLNIYEKDLLVLRMWYWKSLIQAHFMQQIPSWRLRNFCWEIDQQKQFEIERAVNFLSTTLSKVYYATIWYLNGPFSVCWSKL